MPNYQQTPNRDPQSAGSTSNQQSGQRTESTQTPGSTQASKSASTSPTSSQGSMSQGSTSSASKSDESLSDRANKAVDQYKSTAIERMGDVRERAESGLLAQRQGVTERIQRMGDMLRSAGDQVRREDEFVARYLDVASVRAEKLASYIENADFASLADDVGRFARERPAWVIGGSFIAGLAIGRFLKSAAPTPEFGERSQLGYERGGSRRYETAPTRPASYSSESSQSTGYTQGSGYQSSGYQGSGYQGSSYGQSATQKPSTTPGSSSASSTYPQSYTSSTETSTPKSSYSSSTSPSTSTPGASTSSSTPSTSTPSTSTSSATSGSSVGTTQKVGFPQGSGTRKGES